MRTSQSHPLQIATVQPAENTGRIGITFCPGKVQPGAMSGSWNRDLGLDLDAIADWGLWPWSRWSRTTSCPRLK
jgi:ADP-ribosyl-[dinitrogen reductase] hydrolase